MTLAAIGSVTFDSMRGPPFQAPRAEISTWTRPGVAGAGAVIGASHPVPWTGETLLADTWANCVAAQATYEALVGTKVSATDEHNQTYAGTLVLDVECQIDRAVGGVAIGAVLTATWKLLPDVA
jgi:hypothetical protein